MEIIKLFPVKENLVTDIPAGDSKNDNFFYSVKLANAKVVTVLGSIPASSDKVKSKGQQIKQC
jgi:hypothetical protein